MDSAVIIVLRHFFSEGNNLRSDSIHVYHFSFGGLSTLSPRDDEALMQDDVKSSTHPQRERGLHAFDGSMTSF